MNGMWGDVKGTLEYGLVLGMMQNAGLDGIYGNAMITDNAPYLKWLGETYRSKKPLIQGQMDDYIKNFDYYDLGGVIYTGTSMFIGVKKGDYWYAFK